MKFESVPFDTAGVLSSESLELEEAAFLTGCTDGFLFLSSSSDESESEDESFFLCVTIGFLTTEARFQKKRVKIGTGDREKNMYLSIQPVFHH